MSNPLNALLRQPPPEGADFRWGYVTDTDPFEVTLDTETSPIPTPSTLVSVELGDRVFVLLESRHATVLGKVPEVVAPPTTTTTTTVAPTLRMRAGQTTFIMSGEVRTTSVSFGVTFPSPPRVFVQMANDAASGTQATAENASTTGFTLRVRAPTATSTTWYINWLAVPNGSFSI